MLTCEWVSGLFSFEFTKQSLCVNLLGVRTMTAGRGHWGHPGLFHRWLFVTVWPCENAMLQRTLFAGWHFEIRHLFIRLIRGMRFLLFHTRRWPIHILHQFCTGWKVIVLRERLHVLRA